MPGGWEKRRKPYSKNTNRRQRRKKLTVSKVKKIVNKAVKQLSAIKHHYVTDTGTTSVGAPFIVDLTGIGAGETPITHEGDKIRLRSFDLHGYVRVTNTGGTPSVSHPTRWNLMVVRTTLDTGLAGVPSYADIYDTSLTTGGIMAEFDGFRQLNVETLSKLKILVNKSFTLSPNSYDATTGYSSYYPGYRQFRCSLKLKDDEIEYRTGSAVALNAQYYLMIQANSTGAAGNLGLEHSIVSKMTFRDVE